jgi:hypothetical protein
MLIVIFTYVLTIYLRFPPIILPPPSSFLLEQCQLSSIFIYEYKMHSYSPFPYALLPLVRTSRKDLFYSPVLQFLEKVCL